MIKALRLGLVVLVPIAALCPEIQAAAISIDVTSTRQTMTGIGGDITKIWGASNIFDNVAAYELSHLSVHAVRVSMDLDYWEPVSTNSDPNTFNISAFQDAGPVHATFLAMQQLQSQGMPIIATVWQVPNWMVINPTAVNGRTFDQTPQAEGLVIESMAAFLWQAKNAYGVDVDYVTFNEPEQGNYVGLSSSQQADLIKLGGARFASLGLKTRWLAGDTATAHAAVAYTEPILQDPVAMQYIGAISYHAWDGYSDDTVFDGIAALGQKYGLPVWCLEMADGDPGAWSLNPAPWPTWQYAWDTAQSYYKILAHSQASAVLYWEYDGDFPLMDSSNLIPYPAYYVVKQIADNLLPGAQMVSATADSGLQVFAAKDQSRGRFMLHVINGGSDMNVTLAGIPSTTLTLQRTSPSENMVTAGSYPISNASATVPITGGSISVLTGDLGGNPPQPTTAAPAAPGGVRVL